MRRVEIVESNDGRGKIAVALRDYQPGEVIFYEKPFLMVTENDAVLLQQYDRKLVVHEYARRLMWQFKKMSDVDQARVLNLHCPLEAPAVKTFVAQLTMNEGVQEQNRHCGDDNELFMKIVAVSASNSFLDGPLGSPCLFVGPLTRMSHSCAPNCIIKPFARGVTSVKCYAPIKAGDELTHAYIVADLLLPTYQRREKLMEEYQFLCMCSRCSAIGDDTRRLPCYDTKCRGAHFVSQQTAKIIPFVLPCDVCNNKLSSEEEQRIVAAPLLLDGGMVFRPSQALIMMIRDLDNDDRNYFRANN